MIRVVVMDDQSYERLHMRVLFENCDGVELVGEFSGIEDAERINELCPDAIFLDIDLGTASGFDLLPLLTGNPKIIFVTLYDQYTLQAFRVNALDYLMKPVTLDRLQETMNRLYEQKRLEDQQVEAAVFSETDLIHLQEDGRQALVAMERLAAIQSDGDFTIVHVEGLPGFFMRRRMKKWQEMLPESLFIALDRSCIINRRRLTELRMTSETHSELTLAGCEKPFPLGKTATRTARRLMKNEP